VTCTYQVERFAAIAEELPPLWVRHWRRLGTDQARVPLAPDVPKYYDMDRERLLHIVTVRDTKGALIGYYFTLIPPKDLHYTGLKRAWTDIYFIDPTAVPPLSLVAKYRRLIEKVEVELRALGVQDLRTAVKLHSDIGPIWDQLGYTPVERVYYRRLGD
jgi:hypothetical protein